MEYNISVESYKFFVYHKINKDSKLIDNYRKYIHF